VTLGGLRHRPAVIVDCDPGIDDALALLFLARLHHRGRLRLQAVVTVAGNAGVACTTRNARFVLGRAGLREVPVISGAPGPLAPLPAPVDALAFHGPDGLGGHYTAEGLPGLDLLPALDLLPGSGDLATAASRGAVDGPLAIVDQLRSASAEGEAVLLALGPLTNVALALELEPDLHRLTRRVVVMGGAFGNPGGNVTPTAEFNWYCDPDAADRVVRSQLPLEVVPLDVTERVTVVPASLGPLTGDPPATLAAGLLRSSIDLHRAVGYGELCHVHDALAAAVVAEPDLVRTERLGVRVSTAAGDPGRAVFAPSVSGPGVALAVDADRALGLILSVIGGQFPAPIAPPA